MSDEDTRRDLPRDTEDGGPDTSPDKPLEPVMDTPGKTPAANTPDEIDYTPDDDPYIKALREIPRMSDMGERDAKGRVYSPPPPMASRFGGFFQGCGGVMLTLVSLPMLLAALWFGYYLWGPGLFLTAGLLLVFGAAGTWSGRRTTVIVAMVAMAALLFVAVQWNSFIPAAGALAPIGPLGAFFAPLTVLMAFVLVLAFVTHVITLFYWRRLKPVFQRGAVIWTVAGVSLAFLAVAAHFVQQQQRESWFVERLDTWRVVASADDLALGANVNVTLGYSFVTLDEDDESRFDVRLAELRAVLDSGSAVVRMSAGGDLLLEQDEPRMFADADDEEDLEPDELEARRAARIARQQALQDEYMSYISDSDAQLFISDSQYSPYLLVWASDLEGESLPWDEFTRVHAERVRYYASTYQPAFYEIVTEPRAYDQFSGLAEFDDEADWLEAWTAHTAELIAVVQEESPDTQIGVSVAIHDDSEMDFYDAALAMDGIDFIGFRIFQSAAYERIEDILIEYGHPADVGKELWITETWYGYCLAPQRSMELDAEWLEVAVAFAAKERISVVLPSDFGCFLQPGGTLFQDYDDEDDRTEVWEAWRTLSAVWNAD